MHASSPFYREIAWSAVTCRLRDADIFLGLAAMLDDAMMEQLTERQMIAFPFREIPVTQGAVETVPLRIYTVGDASIVTVVPANGDSTIDGFRRVRLHFRVPEGPRHPRGDALTGRGVMAFLLTIGLAPGHEDEFFNVVVRDFLDKSWMSLPKLLTSIGCAHSEEIAARK